jgi:Tfp pilus assembly protein PilP
MPSRNELIPICGAAFLAILAVIQVLSPLSYNLPKLSQPVPRPPTPVDRPVARDYPSVLGAALFSPDRPSVPGVIDIAGTLEGYRLLGIAMAGRAVSAVVQGPGGAVSRIAVGATLDGWTLLGADRSRLVFIRGREQRVLLVNAN